MSVGDLNVELEDVDILSESNLNIVSVTPPAIEEEVEEIEEEEGVDQEDESQDTSDEKTDAPSPDGADDNTGN